MDPVSQAALGGAWAQPAARRAEILAATAVGALAGMAPDSDVLIRSSTDPLLALEFHRHFTHSLAFLPFGALLCTVLLYPVFRRQLSFARCYGFAMLGIASHGLLDACTSYGTLLLWPFSHERIAWDVVSVIDPLFTLPLIGFLLYGALRKRPAFALIGTAWCVAYLGLGLVQNLRATNVAVGLAATRGHAPGVIEVKPSFGNILLWKSFYEHDGRYFIDAVRVGLVPRVFEGESLVKLNVARDFPWLGASTQQRADIERFSRFASGYLALDRNLPNRIVDIRYSLVPNRGDGLWGIEVLPNAGPESHAVYVTMRIRSADEGRALLRMIFQGDLAE